ESSCDDGHCGQREHLHGIPLRLPRIKTATARLELGTERQTRSSPVLCSMQWRELELGKLPIALEHVAPVGAPWPLVVANLRAFLGAVQIGAVAVAPHIGAITPGGRLHRVNRVE